MKFLCSLLILSMGFSAFADCRIPQGNSFVVVGEGQTISLLSEGKSLANHKVQDQDGLGTCYANTASTVLKSVLPGNPDLSYLHLAVQSSTNGKSGNFDPKSSQYWRMGKESKMESFADGGFICETIDVVKKLGGACKREQSLLESDRLPEKIQEEAFKNLGIYFDALNKAKDNPQEYEKLKKDLILSVEAINNQRNNLKLACEEQKKSELPLEGAISNFLASQYFRMSDDSFCSKVRFEQFQKLTSTDSTFQKDRTRIKPSDDFLNKVRTLIMNDASLKKNMLILGSGKQISRLIEIDMGRALGSKISDIFNATVPAKKGLPVCSDEKEDPVLKDLTPESIGDIFISDVKNSKKTSCEIKDETVLAEVFSKNSCIAPVNLDRILSAVTPLLKVGMKVDEKLKSHLLNTNPTSAGQLKNLLMPGCYKPENLMPLANVSCETYSPCDINRTSNFDNSYYTGPAGGCHDLDTAKKEARKLIHSGLMNNRALGVSVCTSFMINPDRKTDFCKNKGPGVDKHTYHAMTVSGLRCSKGKVEYQLVNSWGRYNCPKGAQVSDAIVCEKDKLDLDTGKFWVKEDVMVDSMTGLSEIKNGAQ